ncbi:MULTISPECIES: GlsB/YeaQ/YmgE family stress response membrane protein [Thermocrispum]|jgi:uncharacterized membrane protein YeaQ/YmgE (transglycosylase-associated protein family)|uniref:GlsB/YeaQ/YmgE family stress response membrane protein n=1 Tax=Thermocrispum agreste TaxID=37925 RepID=A0ABD6FLG4_9PSEU|nr:MULTISPECIES: GlsB/YeaQ/YmgE family stress response membrane protein [Thermocrispum]
MADTYTLAASFSEALGKAFDGWGIFGFLITGIILGLLAKLVIPGDQGIPLWLTIICGILGGGLGNVVYALFGGSDTAGFDWLRHGLQLAGAVVVVLIAAAVYPKSRGRTAA